ncbi:MAG: DUF421 domain-containing protein [Clostridiales bacterium]|nr:DUF421 domain-containing protein [Candidatus Equinaster intestinalis]
MVITLIRTFILYIFVTIGIRLMGKRQIGDMQPNELVVTLLISEIAAIPLQDTTQPLINGVVAIFVLVIIEIVLSAIAMKSGFIRKILSGQSVIIIENGKIDQQAMKKVRLTVIDLIELLRSKDVFDISTVAYAILEVNGSLSVLLKNTEQTVTKNDMKIKTEKDGLLLPVIVDGKIIPDALKNDRISEEKFDKILKSKKINPDNVFLMSLDSNGKNTVIRKEEK